MKTKIFRLSLLVLVLIVLVGCNQTAKTHEPTESEKIKIGISKIVDHKALNDAQQGFVDRLGELGIEAEFIEENAQGDVSNALLIANNFVSEKTDLILAIATPTSQAAQKAVQNTDIPVIFTAVSDPVSAGLVESLDNTSGNITGVTDAVTPENLEELLNLFKQIKPDAKTLGVIFNTGEVNSTAQVNTLKEVTAKVGLELVEVGISEIANIDQALETISTSSDALILINDNMIASSVQLIAEKAKAKGLITLSSDSSHVEEGAFLSLGISYRQLGEQAADIAKMILVDKVPVSEIPVQNSNTLFKFVNVKAAEALGINIDIEILKDATKIN